MLYAKAQMDADFSNPTLICLYFLFHNIPLSPCILDIFRQSCYHTITEAEIDTGSVFTPERSPP